MMPALHIVRHGLLTTVQDLGRPGYQHLGVPVGGALDPVALRAANALAGNAPGAGALEALYVGPTIEIEADEARLAFAGAHATIEILPDKSARDGMPVEAMRSVLLRRGETVRIGSLSGGAARYIAAEGGFDISPAFGSVATDIRGGIGGWQGRALIEGDRLPLRRSQASNRDEWRIDGLDLAAPARLRAIAGPQRDYFAESEIAAFFAAQYTVGAGADRMGMRLEGRRIDHARGHDITSDGIAPGSIQVLGNGQPVVLLVDRQTTGGYPKIATVVSADLPALGRLPIGAKIAFEQVTVEAAQALRRALFAEIERIHERIVPVGHGGAEHGDVTPLLFDYNLISGVVDARNWMM
jgi:biotin-dependent carboxylase-like uncharacterized protein